MDSRLWLSHAVNATLDMSMETVPDLDGISSVEWMSAKHGFDHGQVSDLLNNELVSKLRVEYSEIHAVNLVMHKLHLGLSLLGLIERRDAALELIACCAFVTGRIEEGVFCLQQRGGGTTVSDDLVASVASDLLSKDLHLDEHLSRHPMAHLRMWSDYRLFGQMSLCIRAARSEPGGQPDEMDVQGARTG